jgi:hypothetical protein
MFQITLHASLGSMLRNNVQVLDKKSAYTNKDF